MGSNALVVAAMLLVAPIVAFLLTRGVRRYAVSASIVDIPNARSSHTAPTPRGGGMAIVVVVLAALPLLYASVGLPGRETLALFVGGASVAGIGWWDDRANLPAHWRLLAHIAAALVVVLASGSSNLLPAGTDWGWVLPGGLGLVLFIAWVLNLYNFMDGIDGLAGIEAVTVAGVGALILLWSGEADWALLAAVLALASAGFLAWNWPPAKIFMGDAGSGFLGFMLAALAVLTWVNTSVTLWPWLILLGVFIVDASVTLLRRALRRERLHEAHRSHAYQHAARYYGSHLPVTVAVLLINLFWLAPWAVVATVWPAWGAAFVLAAWLPLLLVCLRFRSGVPE